jgi:hypothetical protein
MINVAQFLDLSKNAMVQWAKAREEFPVVRQQLFNIKGVSERTSEYSDIGTGDTARRRDDGDDAWKGTLHQGYTTNFTQQEIALQVDVTKQMRMFDKYDEIMKRMRRMGKNTERRMEMDAAAYLSYAWSSSYTNIDGETVATTTPDGNTLIYTGHTNNGPSSATYSNEIDTTHSPIDDDVLESLIEKFNNFIDEADGRNVPVSPTHIITGRHAPTVYQVMRLINPVNDMRPFTANNDRAGYSWLQHLIVPFIDLNMSTEARDANKYRYCFLANLGDMDENGFVMEVSQDIKFEAPEQVFESGTWQFQTTGLYDTGVTRANFIAGTKGDGNAV